MSPDGATMRVMTTRTEMAGVIRAAIAEEVKIVVDSADVVTTIMVSQLVVLSS